MQNQTQRRKGLLDVRTMATLGILTALSFLAMLLGHIIPPVAGFLQYDPKDAVIVIIGFLFGPLASLIVSIFVAILEMPISGTGPYGLIMNVVSSASFAFTATLIYKSRRTMTGAVVGLCAGVAATTIMMLLWNYIVTPFYMNVERDIVKGMLVSVFLPFNLVKGGINTAVTLLIYKPVKAALTKARLIPASEAQGKASKKISVGVVIAALLLLATSVMFFLSLSGII